MGPNLTRTLLPVLSSGYSVSTQIFGAFPWRFLNAGLGRYATALAGVGLAWGLFQRKQFALILAIWVGTMYFLANLGAFGLPGSWLINLDSVAITLFMPVSVAAGSLLSQLIRLWEAALLRWQRLYWACLALAGLLLLILGARNIITVLNPATYLFRQADRAAIDWIDKNIPPGETILINPFLWGYGVYAGNDGGFWISPLSGRKTLPPPVIYGFGGQAEYFEIEAVCKEVLAQGSQPDELWSLLRSHGVRYIYLGVRGGPISPYELSNSPRFRLLYHQFGTWVFAAVD
jgi:hypothetical protein